MGSFQNSQNNFCPPCCKTVSSTRLQHSQQVLVGVLVSSAKDEAIRHFVQGVFERWHFKMPSFGIYDVNRLQVMIGNANNYTSSVLDFSMIWLNSSLYGDIHVLALGGMPLIGNNNMKQGP